MLFALIVMYVVTLVYFSVVERFRYYASLVMVQGLLLFGIAFMRLHSASLPEMIFVLAETLLFKGIVVPLLLFYIINHTGVNRVKKGVSLSGLNSLLLFVAGFIVSAGITYFIADNTVNKVFFAVAMYALICGLLLIITNKRIFSHLVGFLVIENGVFLFSMAVGVEMPILVNIAILLDILLSVLMLGIFFSKMGDRLDELDEDNLTTLKN